ncbi:hypothetical protein [Pseudomarimonas arenosa]|nr:hypothetical protein [Pseudomarimonas arenosa]
MIATFLRKRIPNANARALFYAWAAIMVMNATDILSGRFFTF